MKTNKHNKVTINYWINGFFICWSKNKKVMWCILRVWITQKKSVKKDLISVVELLCLKACTNPVVKTIKSQYSCTHYQQRKSSVWFMDIVVENAKAAYGSSGHCSRISKRYLYSWHFWKFTTPPPESPPANQDDIII